MLTKIRCIQIKEEINQYKTIKIMIQASKNIGIGLETTVLIGVRSSSP
jgi:hypothetical protein